MCQRNRIGRTALVIASALLVISSVGCRGRDARTGVVLITLDTVRGDLFDWSQSNEFPAIKKLFAEGVRFDQAISSSPVTGPAHASIFTGLPPTEHGVLSNLLPLKRAQTTLAERLKALGFQTGGFVSCSLLGQGRGFAQGFDRYDAEFSSAYARGHFERSADRTTDRAIEWLEQMDGRPFFLWIHYFDAHAPYAPPAEFRPEGFDDLKVDAPTIRFFRKVHDLQVSLPRRQVDYYRALYRGQLEFVDQQIGRLVRHLEEHHADDAITYVLTADHGEELGDHMNFYEHNRSLYDGVLRVPLAIRAPGLPAERVGAQVDPASITAALLELLGQPVPAGLEPSFLGETGRSRPRVGAKELDASVRPWGAVIREPPWKYFYYEDGREELYDVRTDPGERTNLAHENPQQLERLREVLEREVLPTYASPELERQLGRTIDAETREMLRALGYL
jgi:arylsulfatase A-like enzyme